MIAAFVLTSLVPVRVDAQGTSTIEGTVRDSEGQPLAGAVVLVLGTLERVITDSAGEFVVDAGAHSSVVLIVRQPGYRLVRRTLRLPRVRPVIVIMRAPPSVMESVPVEAGMYRLGSTPNATLSDLEILSTPSAAGDPFRAIQTLAGLQGMGDGAGLFVRGGGVSETRVLVEGAPIMSPFRLQSERTVSLGRFDPLHLGGIYFSAGGFSAEYGDALSAIVDIEIAGKPIRNGVGLTASSVGLSGDLSIELSESAGMRMSAGYTNTDLLMRMNGRREEFEEVPVSSDFSGAGEWIYRPSGSIKVFAFFQRDHVGFRRDLFIGSDIGSGIYSSDVGSNFFAVSGRDTFSDVRLSWKVSTSGARNEEGLSEWLVDRSDRLTQARAKVEVPVSRWIALAAGAEIEDRRMDRSWSLSTVISLPGIPPRTIRFDIDEKVSGTRLGGFGELDLQPSRALRLRLGLRSDYSSFTGRTTVDPRVSASFRPGGHLALTAAWGAFHQVPDVRFYSDRLGQSFGDILGRFIDIGDRLEGSALPAMSARHFIAGVTYHNGDRLIRAEAYRKLYKSLAPPAPLVSLLASLTPDGSTQGGGRGETTGFDVFVKEDLEFLGLTGRVAYSFIRSERTDPNTEELAPSPYDVTNTLNVVFNRRFGWLRTGVAYRIADGAPFTPVAGSEYNALLDLWQPVYGVPRSERFPTYSRLDVSISVIRSLWRRNITVFFFSVMNALNRQNVSYYRYNQDYSERTPLKSPFPRSIFFGVTTTLPY